MLSKLKVKRVHSEIYKLLALFLTDHSRNISARPGVDLKEHEGGVRADKTPTYTEWNFRSDIFFPLHVLAHAASQTPLHLGKLPHPKPPAGPGCLQAGGWAYVGRML